MSTYITESYALKYYGECFNYRKQRSRVEIWQKGTVDSTFPRKIGDITGLSLAINGNEDIEAPFIKTILNLSMVDTWDEPQIAAANAVKHGVWDEFYTPDSTAYLVKLLTMEEGDDSWELRWSGYITPDNWQETIGYRGTVGIVARDNLGHLQDFDFDLEGDASGLVSAYDIIDGAFRKIAFPMNVDIGTVGNGSRAALLEPDAPAGSRGLFDACINVENFKGDSWESAFKDVLDSLGLTVRFVDRNTVVVTYIRNLPLCGYLVAPEAQTIEFYGNGTRMLVPAYRDVKIETDFDYEREVTFPAKILGAYGTNDSFHWRYYDERRKQMITGDALRCDVAQAGRGWFSSDKAFVNPSSYYITQRGGGAAIVDTETTALLIANATAEEVQQAAAGFTFGRINTPAAIVSLEVTASFTLSGRYLLRSGGLTSYEWAAVYAVGNDVYRWNGSQWKATAEVWTETTENKMDFSAPMNLQDIEEGGELTIYIRNIKASAGFCIGVEGVTINCNDPATSLKSDTVSVVNNSAFNVRAKRTPRYGFLSKEVVWNVVGNYPNVFWKRNTGGKITPWPYQSVWSDGTENLSVPVQWAKQALMFHHTTLQQIEGEVGVINNGMWRFDRPAYYKGHYFLQRGGTLDLTTGHISGLSLREYIEFATLWAGAATVAPQSASFPQSGGSVSFLVTAEDNKEWEVTGLPDWLTASVERGTGSGAVTITADVNDYGARSRTIFIAGVAIRISQAQRSFDLYFEPDSINVTADGRSLYATIQASADKSWRLASSDESWILVNGLDEWEDTGYNDAVIVRVQTNETGSERDGSLFLYDDEDNLVQTIPVHQGTEGGGEGQDLTLTITTNVDSPTIDLTIDGVATPYAAGMVVAAGAQVSLVISKTGYSSVTDSFAMSAGTTALHYELSSSVNATISFPKEISSAEQAVRMTVSDPSGHGWEIDWDMASYYGYVTGGAVVSGNASVSGNTISGTGDAVLTLSVARNSSTQDREIGDDPATIYFWDAEVGFSGSYRYVWFTQLGTSSSSVLVTSITLNKTTLSLNAGSSEKLTATVLPANATNPYLTWSSSNTAVASVGQDGTVYANAAGTCTITAAATDGSNKTATCTVTVTGSNIPVSSVSLNKTAITLNTGGTTQLAATINPTTATNKSVTWSSSDTSVATVSSSGLVTAVGVGTATITVTTVDGGKTATCAVTVSSSGTLSANDITVKSSATSASTILQASGIKSGTLAASCPASWVTGVSVDTSGSPFYVRLSLERNTDKTASRTATVTVTGKDNAGNTVSATFDVTQNAKVPSDEPCTGMSIVGDDALANSANEASYTAEYAPEGCTQDECDWSLSCSSSIAVLTTDGNTCKVTLVDENLNNFSFELLATNHYNGSISARKTITATYVRPAAALSVTPGSVTVAAADTSDSTPQLTLGSGVTRGALVRSWTGFITSAAVNSQNKVVTVFQANESTLPLSGKVTISYTDPVTSIESVVTITYTQAGVKNTSVTLGLSGLNISQSGGTITALLFASFTNDGTTSFRFKGLGYTIVGYDANDVQVFSKTGTLPERELAAKTTEYENYTVGWSGSLGNATKYVVTLRNGTQQSVTIESDGNDQAPIV